MNILHAATIGFLKRFVFNLCAVSVIFITWIFMVCALKFQNHYCQSENVNHVWKYKKIFNISVVPSRSVSSKGVSMSQSHIECLNDITACVSALKLGGTSTALLSRCLSLEILGWWTTLNFVRSYIKTISLVQCKTAVSPLLMHWRYCRLALSHQWWIWRVGAQIYGPPMSVSGL